jgi:PQQ-dependent catabolism-associated CXXCW motif protein
MRTEIRSRFLMQLLVLSAVGGYPSWAPAADVSDPTAVPALGEKGRATYSDFLAKPPNRAFAVSERGSFGYAWRRDTRSQAVAGALFHCNKAARDICRVYALNDEVIHSRYAAFEERGTALRDALKKETFMFSEYGNEAQDFGIPAPGGLHKGAPHAPTPLSLKDVSTVRTVDLVKLLNSAAPPILIDVLGGDGHATLPGAYWIRGAGIASSGEDVNAEILERFGLVLSGLTRGDKTAPLVFFCLDSHCWLSYNAALRARDLGYTNVHWYRGGTKAWTAARLETLDALQYGQVMP